MDAADFFYIIPWKVCVGSLLIVGSIPFRNAEVCCGNQMGSLIIGLILPGDGYAECARAV